MKEPCICSICGAQCHSDTITEFDGQLFCESCLEEETTLCDHCGDRILRDRAEGNCEITLCRSCFDNDFTTCEQCGTLIRNVDAYFPEEDDIPYCRDCCEEHSRSSIHSYYYKPTPTFYGAGPRYFGVELELDRGGELCNNASKLLSIANRDSGYLYAKHDGSLDDGFELVSEPCSLSYHEKEIPWNEVLQEAAHLGYVSHKAGTCGLHVHISRNAFGEEEAEQDRYIARILYFVEKHWEELLKFSRRTESQLKRWAARYGYQEHPTEILDRAKNGYSGGRYTCVNLTNTDTIEFRMFRGTLKFSTFLATLQMVNAICNVATFYTDENVQELSWTSFVSGLDCKQYPELIAYLKERRLYTNEPVLAAEEV
ncbi:amidoligase family protein [Oscillibacter ruminantium]|uniref:amidoligase family protein n=1 Tax=Oscillibacter ruminantium TaxID=1263547 RepID=UPI0002E9775B|nr:amidoligase family protein [Oscillibacter ruminantium]